jgi:hypothetical protein
MRRLPIVTDHAVLRYVERVAGVDLDHLRAIDAPDVGSDDE